MEKIELTQSQQSVFKEFKNGKNIFLTGKGGSGKSFLTRHIIDWCKSKGKNVIVCAPTGVAAQNIEGSTIHRTFRAPIGIIDTNTFSKTNRCYDGKTIKLLKKTDVVIIDEISMVRADLFSYIANTIFFIKQQTRRSIQLLVVGDFYQLPPVLVPKDKPTYEQLFRNAIFPFQMPHWNKLGLQTMVLTESMRQADQAFVSALDNIREGNPDFDIFKGCQCENEDSTAITICGTNKEAFDINEKNMLTLTKQGAKQQTFSAIVEGKVSSSDWPTEQKLKLCDGARIIMLNNDPDGRWVNGTFGVVSSVDEDGIAVLFEDGNVVSIPRYEWKIMEYNLVTGEDGKKKLEEHQRASIKQFPVKLAWAISIHKSQGQTYERVNVNIRNIFTYGQLYVSLSRCKTLPGMRIIGKLTGKKALACPEVIKFMNGDQASEELAEVAATLDRPLINDRYQEGWDDGYAYRSREFEEEYQERLANDPSVKKLSPRVAREREKDALPEEERNPRNAGRKPKAEEEKRPSKAIRVPLAIADVLKQLGELSQENPEVLTRCKEILEEFEKV